VILLDPRRADSKFSSSIKNRNSAYLDVSNEGEYVRENFIKTQYHTEIDARESDYLVAVKGYPHASVQPAIGLYTVSSYSRLTIGLLRYNTYPFRSAFALLFLQALSNFDECARERFVNSRYDAEMDLRGFLL